ncbi:CAP domain-containing protein [Autumnicola musiva]|uniref:CAP domain-containing protein n=1 Tax=Autumnicola musiva TaxID=3075589 RepID=A0ABU3D9K0_9FLAO|nr:CAP domain-containing protein [Zunongwangia sp. F117]MDT0678218.1 CAP domain-containing protein [Zunongwangia sp. F117]
MFKRALRFVMVLYCTISLVSCSKKSIEEEVKSYDQVAENKISYNYTEVELEILERINAYRTKLGLGKLNVLHEVSVEAENHTEYMISKGEVSHDNFPVRYGNLVNKVGAREVSENVAFGYHTADAVVKAWTKSEGHRLNIEGEHTHFGISVKEDSEGKNYYTNIFITR